MAATEGVGPYISKEPNLASQFGRAQKVYFPKPKNPMIVNEEPLHILHETDEIMQQSSPKDSPWLSANKAAVRLAKVTDKNWPQKVESGALPEALTEVLRQRGHDAVLVRSGGEEWAVLLPKMKGSKVSLRTTRIFQIKLDPTGLPPEKALEFFERKAVLWGADIRQPLLGQVKNILFDGIKQGTSLRDLMMRIREAYLPWLGDPDQAIDEIMLTPYRLETLVRTNITEALNEGRKAQFQSAVDDGFVIGLQYSAILDDRTCFRAGTKIRMASGNSLPIEQILPGDMILAGSGISRQVLGLKRYVANKWRRIKTDIGAEVLCTETHPFWTEQGWREAHEIRIGETLGANLFGVRKSRDGFPGEEPPQDLRKDMPIYSGPSYQVQQADSADMQEVRELDSRFKRIREKTQVLLCEMLSDAGGKSRETMCPMRKEDGTFGSLCEKESRSEEMLLKCMLSDISQAWGAEGIDRDPMRNMSATFSGKSWNHSEREAETALLSCVSKEARKSELPSMQEDIRDETTGGSEILLSSMLSEIETGNPDRGNGSCGIGALWDSISAGGSTGSVCTGLSSSRTSLGNRGRRGILASERLFRQEGTGHQGGGITVIPNSSGRGFGSIQAGPIEGVDCAPCPAPVEWAKVAANDPLDELAIAYDIEVAQDHCYLAEGLIAHNTEVCRHLDQKIFSPNSPDLDRLTPPRHWNCRSLLTPVTRIEGPVQYISPAQVAKGIELSGKGFSQENLTQAYAFDPNQPRDEDGKWSAEGGGSNAKSEDAIRGEGSGKDKTFVNADGSPVDAATQDRIKALGLPPAWTNVQVSADPKSPLQAIGTDASGKEQYRYSKQWRTERNAAKHLRVAALAQDGYKTMVKGVERDLRQGKEEAVVMSLVLSTAMRIGGRSEKAIGATTLEAQHLSVSGDLVRFAFPGKSGKQWEGTIRNEALAKQISMRLKGKSGTDRVFGVTAIKVNTYLKQYGQMSAKDVRTLQGTAIAHKVAKELGMPTTVKEAKGYIKTISIKVAEHLRNTPAVAKSSYINPAIWAPIQAKFGISVLK
jgi:DNA topoisomerase I